MIDCLSVVETDKVIHNVETDIVKLVVKIESFGMSSDEFDNETGLSDGLQPKQADLICVHALNKLHLHEIRVIPSGRLSAPERIALSARVVIEKLYAKRLLCDRAVIETMAGGLSTANQITAMAKVIGLAEKGENLGCLALFQDST
nr:hypothetical protein [Tanacetum cinerariifolium]